MRLALISRLVYTIDGVTLSRNIIFDLPLLLYAHAWKSGVIEDSAGRSLADAFTSHTDTLFTVKSDCQSQPVFVRHKVGNRADLDYSGPLRAGTVFGRFRSLMTQTGLIGRSIRSHEYQADTGRQGRADSNAVLSAPWPLKQLVLRSPSRTRAGAIVSRS